MLNITLSIYGTGGVRLVIKRYFDDKGGRDIVT